MKKFEFVNVTPIQEKLSLAGLGAGALAALWGVTGTVASCYVAVALAGIVGAKLLYNKNFIFNIIIRSGLYQLVKNNGFYKSEDGKLVYKPTIYYDFDDKVLQIKIRLDGSSHIEKYLSFENLLENLFVMECIDKKQEEGYIIYALDRTHTQRLNISNIDIEDTDLIPINNKISWNYRKFPGAILNGNSGSGKTIFLASLIKIFTQIGAKIYIIDPKKSDLSYLERVYSSNVASSPNDVARLLRVVVEKMNERYETFKSLPSYKFGKDYKDLGFKPVVIFIDEIASLMAASEKKVSNEIESRILDLVLKGRQSGYFVICSSQRGDTEFLKGVCRDQLHLRIGLGNMNKTGYNMLFPDANDIQLNDNTVGSGFIQILGVHTKPVKFQSPLFEGDYNFVKDLANIKRRSRKF